MTNDKFINLIDDTFNTCKKLLDYKSNEYDFGEDRLHSFKVAAELQKVNNVVALRGYLTKHIISIFDMMTKYTEYPISKWEEKIHDVINYMLLLKALIIEEESRRTWCREVLNPTPASSNESNEEHYETDKEHYERDLKNYLRNK